MTKVEKREYDRARYQRIKEERLAQVRAYARTERGQEVQRRKNQRLRWTRHGITPERAAELLLEQGDACAVSLEPLTLETAQVDHDHACCPGPLSCGQCIRGLVCDPCNKRVAYVESATSEAAPEIAAYLARGYVGVA
jgi:recombination endonuclease VII